MGISSVLGFIRFASGRIRERLWVKPLCVCVLSVLGVFLANLLDGTRLTQILPVITPEAVEALLTIMTASMLVIATFAVGAMVSAYASASSVATPRSFVLIVADDVSQNALSVFVGAFIFSTVALVAMKGDRFESAGRFAVFVMAILAFAAVILLFVRWVDRIARLGRLGATIAKVEEATAKALIRRRDAPTLRAAARGPEEPTGQPVFSATVGYVQRIDIAGLQAWAEKTQTRVIVESVPGTLVTPNRPLAYVNTDPVEHADLELEQVAREFTIGNQRLFDDDPRFGLVVMSQIAARSLSPGVNDPGTAIDVIVSLVRLFVLWNSTPPSREALTPKYDRVEVPRMEMRDLFDDAFTAISRDGAGTVEVSLRLQKSFHALAAVGDVAMRDAALHQARLALARAEMALKLPDDLVAVHAAAGMTAAGDIKPVVKDARAHRPA